MTDCISGLAGQPRQGKRLILLLKQALRGGEALVEVRAAGVNPSDVKAALGLMPYAVSRERRAATLQASSSTGHRTSWAVRCLVPLAILASGVMALTRPICLSKQKLLSRNRMQSASMKPLASAFRSSPRTGGATAGRNARSVETVLGPGYGKVGQAAAQIATWRGAKVIGVVRRSESFEGHASGPVEVVDASAVDVAERVKEMTGGHGADLVFNTVGDPYYAAGTASLAKQGRQVFIAAVNRTVEFDIFAFYRGRHTYVGVDTLALSSVETGAVLRELAPGFASAHLKPFLIKTEAVYPLGAAAEAYRRCSVPRATVSSYDQVREKTASGTARPALEQGRGSVVVCDQRPHALGGWALSCRWTIEPDLDRNIGVLLRSSHERPACKVIGYDCSLGPT